MGLGAQYTDRLEKLAVRLEAVAERLEGAAAVNIRFTSPSPEDIARSRAMSMAGVADDPEAGCPRAQEADLL